MDPDESERALADARALVHARNDQLIAVVMERDMLSQLGRAQREVADTFEMLVRRGISAHDAVGFVTSSVLEAVVRRL